MKKPNILSVIIFLGSSLIFQSLALASGKSLAADRFSPWLNKLEKIFSEVNSLDSDQENKFDKKLDDLIEEVPSTEARVAAFNLQSLGEIYSAQSKDFKKEVKSFAKRLEDAIGQLDYLKTVYESTEKKKDLENYQEGKDDLKKLLIQDEWVIKPSSKKDSRTQQIKIFLDKYDWPKDQEDRAQVLTGVSNQLQKIIDSSFDLSRLEKNHEGEDGKGLHELRRQIRWFLISARVLDGLIVFNETPESCKIPEYKDFYKTDLATSKYSQLFANADVKNPCKIEQCQFLAMSDAANKLGEWKDAAEKDPHSRETDSLPKEYVKDAEKLYQEMQATGLFQELQKSINKCY